MKKLLTLLLTLLMVFTLVGCNSKEDAPVVQEPEKQEEVVEQTKEEPEIVGGYVDAEDGTLTDELKDIFNKALEGLLGATYEPQELVATQVVAGTNYKFLANGTKTTNPITKGTYYIYVNKDLQGNVSLLDIETIEEKQEETPKQDVTQMSFWVVFYDQYGNELQREALKYGTIPEYKSWLPEGFDKWVYKKSQKDVGTLKAITGNTYYQAVCHEVHHSSSDPTPGPTPGPTPPAPVTYNVTFNNNYGTTPATQVIEQTFDGKYILPTNDPTRTGYTFAGWWTNATAGSQVTTSTDVKITADQTLYAHWTPIQYTITYNEAKAYSGSFGPTVYTIETEDITLPVVGTSEGNILGKEGFEFVGWYTTSTFDEGTNITTISQGSTGNVDLYAKWEKDACLAKGTMITMADGLRKTIEDLYEGDLIRVFDHNTGEVSNAKIMDYWQYEEKKSGLITLHFTNDIDVNIVTGHSFYNKEENKYVLLNACNVNEYIGKHFYNVDNNSWETLLSATYSDEKVDTFFIATEGQFDTVAEGMLNVEDGIYYVLRNTFDFDENMKVDQIKKSNDIKKYGLFDNSDFEYLTEEAFEKYGAANLKVALGKGIITEEFLDILKAESITYESENIVEEYIPENVQHSVR